jgi:hypothetical protein
MAHVMGSHSAVEAVQVAAFVVYPWGVHQKAMELQMTGAYTTTGDTVGDDRRGLIQNVQTWVPPMA